MYVQGYMHVMYEVHGFFLCGGGVLCWELVASYLSPPFHPSTCVLSAYAGWEEGKANNPMEGKV